MVDASNSNVLHQDWPASGPTRLHGNGNATNGKITLGYVLQTIQDGYYEVDINEKALRDSVTRYRSFLESSPDPIVIYDIDGLTQYVNPAFEKTFGWSCAELVGKRIDFVPPENFQETMEAIRRLKEGKDVKPMETRR